LYSLVNRLSVVIELGLPEQSLGLVRPGNGERDALGDRTFLLPEVDYQIPFVLQRVTEHELARGDSAAQDLLRCPVRNQGDFVLVLQLPQGQLQPGLTATNDGNFSHIPSPN